MKPYRCQPFLSATVNSTVNSTLRATVVGIALTLLMSASVSAQAERRRVDLKKVEVTGTITQVNETMIRIRTDDGIYLADISETRMVPGGGILDLAPPKIRIHGQRSADSLQRNFLVRFEAEIERFRKSKDVIEQLTVFSETPFTKFGFLDPPAPALDDPELAAKLAEEDAKEEDDAKRKNRNIRQYLVSGILDSFRNGYITVLVPHEGDQKQVKLRISPDAIVDFELNDIKFAAVGNKITAAGETIEALKSPLFYATSVDIEVDADEKMLKIKQKQAALAATEDKPAAEDSPKKDGSKKDGPEEPAKMKTGMGKVAGPDDDTAMAKTDEGGFPFTAAPKTKDESKPDAPTGRRPRLKSGKVVKIN